MNPKVQGLKIAGETLFLAAIFYLIDCGMAQGCLDRAWLLRGRCSGGFMPTVLFACLGSTFGLIVALFGRTHHED